MLPLYTLRVHITDVDNSMSEDTFREQVAPCLSHLDALKGAFDRKPCTVEYYPPNDGHNTYGWSLQGIVMISVGKQRGEYLNLLYQTIVDLITLELPHLLVEYEIGLFRFED